MKQSIGKNKHGGSRPRAGRKPSTRKQTAVTVYIDNALRATIMDAPIPNANSFSQKCKSLIELGMEQLNHQLSNSTGEVKYIDLFAGLGGIRIGFEQALATMGLSGKCVFSSDVKKSAIKAYSTYFGENPECDITKVNPASIPNFDFLLAGFPCQAFSQAGTRLGFQDTRGTLFFNVAKILLEKQPSGFVLENVEGLVSHDKGRTFKIIKETLIQLGYNIQFRVLDGKDFGLAQSRKRIYIIGLKHRDVLPLENFEVKSSVLKDIIDYSVPATQSDFTKKLLSHFDVAELHGKAIKDKRGGDMNIHSWDIELKGKVTPDQRKLLGLLLRQRRNKKWASIIGIDWMDGMPLTKDMIYSFFPHPKLEALLSDLVQKGYLEFEHPKKKEGNRRVYDETLEKGYNIVSGKLSFEFSKILSPESVAPTLVATDVQKLAVPVLDGIRPLTINEGLALFGFPEDYCIDFLKTSEAFDLLGNTVCIPAIKAVSEKLLSSYLMCQTE